MAFDQNGNEDRRTKTIFVLLSSFPFWKFHFGVTMECGDRESSPDLSCSGKSLVEFVAETPDPNWETTNRLSSWMTKEGRHSAHINADLGTSHVLKPPPKVASLMRIGMQSNAHLA